MARPLVAPTSPSIFALWSFPAKVQHHPGNENRNCPPIPSENIEISGGGWYDMQKAETRNFP